MDEHKRSRVVGDLDQLSKELSARLGADPERHGPVAAHVDELRRLVQSGSSEAHASVRHLEQRLTAWEDEHPQLVELAGRVARALAAAGL